MAEEKRKKAEKYQGFYVAESDEEEFRGLSQKEKQEAMLKRKRYEPEEKKQQTEQEQWEQ